MSPGDVLTGRFEVLRGAGSGGMGVVYQARDLATGQSVALKILIGGEESLAARFAQEVQLLSALEHPHIVGYISHGGTADGAPYLVMPWLEGCDLQERVRAKPLSVEETLTVAHRVADALAYLHRRGLVHRDLKPTNLFLPNGELEKIQLIDLGIARGTVPARPLTLSGVLLGTPGFIAPEQAYGSHGVAPAVDIFAFGCVLFECLTGQRLFTGSHVMAVLAKVLLEEAPRVREFRSDVPESLERLIERMVAKEPELRPQDGAELQEWLADLDRVLPASSRSQSAAASLTGSEQRVVSVLVTVLTPPRPSVTPMSEITRAEVNPLQAHSARFGVGIHALGEGVAIALAPEELSADLHGRRDRARDRVCSHWEPGSDAGW
jgi:serine/threonine protein kinase